MNTLNKQSILAWLVIILILLLGCFIQTYIIFNWDVSWLMHVSNRLLHGGHYFKNFIEINPPLILYFYMPPVLATKIIPVGFIAGMRLYTLCIAFFSIFLSNLVIKKAFPNQPLLRYIILILLALIFMFLPIEQFSQREHFTIMLIMPYLWLAALRLRTKPFSLSLALFVGFLAGLGFGIKPYFLIPLALVEIYLLTQKKTLKISFRPETMMIAFVILLYGLSLFIITPEYLHKVLPTILNFYYSSTQTSLMHLLLKPAILFCLATLFFYFYKNIYQGKNREITMILALGTIGFLIAYFIQYIGFDYQLIPATTLAILLMVFCMKYFIVKRDTLSFVFSSLLIIFLTTSIVHHTYTTIQHSSRKDYAWQQMIALTKQEAPHGTLYNFSTTVMPVYPLVDYTNTRSPSKLCRLSSLRGIAKLNSKNPGVKFYRKLILNDLIQGNPNLIFIRVSHSDKEKSEPLEKIALHYFLKNHANFRRFWVRYKPIAKIGTFEVYKRQ